MKRTNTRPTTEEMAATTPPVVLIIFNRPDNAKQVLATIRAAKPAQLFVVADGPRGDRPGEVEKCAAARAIVEEVDWDCEVYTNFSETNLGCRLRVASGITWAFEHVDRAIILEDDCVPSQSFFPYCAHLLDRYEEDERVMMISGDNHLFGHEATKDSYYFSRYPHCWGWATWRRAWNKYDLEMTRWPEIRDRKLFDQYLPKRRERYYWESTFDFVHAGKIDTWDYQWVYSIWANSGLCIAPVRNLVRNIGFESDATHTFTKWDSIYASLTAEEMNLPLTHPPTVLASSDIDALAAQLRAAHHSSGLLRLFNSYLTLAVAVRRGWRRIHTSPTARGDTGRD